MLGTHTAEAGVRVHRDSSVLGVAHPVAEDGAPVVEAEGEVTRKLGRVLHQVQTVRALRQQPLNLQTVEIWG